MEEGKKMNDKDNKKERDSIRDHTEDSDSFSNESDEFEIESKRGSRDFLNFITSKISNTMVFRGELYDCKSSKIAFTIDPNFELQRKSYIKQNNGKDFFSRHTSQQEWKWFIDYCRIWIEKQTSFNDKYFTKYESRIIFINKVIQWFAPRKMTKYDDLGKLTRVKASDHICKFLQMSNAWILCAQFLFPGSYYFIFPIEYSTQKHQIEDNTKYRGKEIYFDHLEVQQVTLELITLCESYYSIWNSDLDKDTKELNAKEFEDKNIEKVRIYFQFIYLQIRRSITQVFCSYIKTKSDKLKQITG